MTPSKKRGQRKTLSPLRRDILTLEIASALASAIATYPDIRTLRDALIAPVEQEDPSRRMKVSERCAQALAELGGLHGIPLERRIDGIQLIADRTADRKLELATLHAIKFRPLARAYDRLGSDPDPKKLGATRVPTTESIRETIQKGDTGIWLASQLDLPLYFDSSVWGGQTATISPSKSEPLKALSAEIGAEELDRLRIFYIMKLSGAQALQDLAD